MSPDNEPGPRRWLLRDPQRAAGIRHGCGRRGDRRDLPWAAKDRIRTAGLNGAITSLSTDGTQIYGTGYAFGRGLLRRHLRGRPQHRGHQLGQRLPRRQLRHFPNSGPLLGQPRARLHVVGSFPDTSPRSRWQKAIAAPTNPTGTITKKDAYGWDFTGLPYAGILHWFPDFEFGSYTRTARPPGRSPARQLPRPRRRVPDGQRRRPAGPGPVREPASPARARSRSTAPRSTRRRRPPSPARRGSGGTASGTATTRPSPTTSTATTARPSDAHARSNFWTLPGMSFIDTGWRRGPPTPTRSGPRTRTATSSGAWRRTGDRVRHPPSAYTQAVRADSPATTGGSATPARPTSTPWASPTAPPPA